MKPPKSIDFTTFVLSISTAAYMGLGVVPFQEGAAPRVDLAVARLNIDVLEMLLKKTKNNLTPDESQLLEQLLFELRLKYVEKHDELKS